MCSKVLQRELPDGVHGDLGEQPVAHLRQQRHGDARQAVEHGQQDRRAQPQAGGGRPVAAAVDRDERVRRPFEGERRRDGHELRDEQQPEGVEHTALQVGPAVRPQIGPELAEGRDEPGALRADGSAAGVGGTVGIRYPSGESRPI